MRNTYAENCGEEDTDFYLCKPFITTPINNYKTFSQKYEEYHNSDSNENKTIKEDKWYNKLLNKLDNYKYYIIGSIILIGVIIVIIRVVKIKKQRELGL